MKIFLPVFLAILAAVAVIIIVLVIIGTAQRTQNQPTITGVFTPNQPAAH
jgi:hypothetical protein